MVDNITVVMSPANPVNVQQTIAPNVNVQFGATQGPAGPPGEQGPPGIQGPAGEIISGTGDLHYTFYQENAASVWTIAHNLGKFPSVAVITSAGQDVEGDITYIDSNNLIITFSASFGGTAYLN